MPIDSHLPQADPFSLVPTFKYYSYLENAPKIFKRARRIRLENITYEENAPIVFCRIKIRRQTESVSAKFFPKPKKIWSEITFLLTWSNEQKPSHSSDPFRTCWVCPDPLLRSDGGLCGDQAGDLLGHPGGEVAGVQGAGQGPLPLHRGEGCGTLGQVSHITMQDWKEH